MDRLAPESPTYNIPSAHLLRGPLDRAALAAALAGVVRRHEALRTRIVAAHGNPGQEVCPPPPSPPEPLPLADLAGLPPARRAPELARLGGREARRGFDLESGPPLRAALVRLGEDDHAFLLTLHHIAADGWSDGVLLSELAVLYAAAAAGEPSPLAPLALQYADFAAWQRAWPEEALAAQLAYWTDKLAGTPALELPGDRARPAIASYRGDTQALDLPPDLTGAVRRLARRHQATVFMVLLAAWHALLARHSGQADFAVGTPVANRTRPELEPLVGLFLNMLALRSDGGGDPSFAELLSRVRRTALEAYDHADIPFERIVDRVNPVRDRSRQPLMQTLLALDSTPSAPLALRDLEVTALTLSARVSRFDLSLGVVDRGGALAGGLEYSTALFDRTSMARLAGHLVRLLTAAAGDPSRRVAEIELLSPAERQQLVAELNDTAADFSGAPGIGADPRLHRWIERQAARTPDETAVVGEDESLTYGELNARANRLARRLRRLGVQVDEPVALCAERSPALVVGLLAILKAGGAYLPLDPSYPPERLAFMLEDGLGGLAAPVLLAPAALLSRLAGPGAAVGARRIDLDEIASPAGLDGADGDVRDLAGGAGADNLAYVIYTSGSTGRPKGVMNTHRGIVNRLLWMQQAYGLTPADRVLQKTPLSFDVSVWELFWPLVVGARLVLARPGGQRDPAYLVRRIAEQGITTLHFVPAMLQAFLEQPDLDRCGSLRRVIASGEALPVELERRFFSLLAAAELDNLYGPTEAAVDVTAHAGAPASTYRSVPIGRPIANLGAWLLDSGLRPVPAGVPGELFLGGVGLARGYLRRPALTAERFVPHPLGGPGERLYRTGDLARLFADGEIEFLGRTDDQVKLRGFRIEPGEIEAALASHPGVREAAVVARRERSGEIRLVAYWVAAASPAPTAAELRQALRRTLPEHMVPADLVLLAALPATPSGKLDRQALRSRDDVPAAHEPAPSAPATELEALLLEIWQDLLGRRPIGVHDNLFDLGAHSLLALQFTTRAQEALDLEIPLHVLFEAPSVKQLAVAIQSAAASPTAALPPLVPLAPQVREAGALPLSFSQQRQWFMDRLAPDSPTYNIPSGFLLRGPLDAAALAAGLGEIVRRHEVLRTRIAVAHGQPVQEICPPARLPLPLADLGGLPAARRRPELARLSRREARRTFDLRRGPLLRATLVRLAGGEHALLLTLHHIASDGWSEGVLLSELSLLYAAAAAGEPSPLAAPALQYADFAAWQRAWPEEMLAAQLAYWTGKLAGTPALDIPADRARPPVQSFRGDTAELDLPPALTDALRRLARQERATVFMTLLAAWHALLQRLSGQADFAVGTPVANRTREELEPLIGLFLNMLVLRPDGGGDPSFAELLGRARRTALEAYAHADVPFERLVDELHPVRDMSRQPLMQTVLALNNTPSAPLALPGLEVSRLPSSGGVSRFDLSLGLVDRGGRLAGQLEYSTDLFDRTSVARLAGHLVRLLTAAAGDPSRRVAEIELLSPAERQQLVAELNDTAADFSGTPGIGADPRLHRWIERQAARTPGETAVVGEGESLTYGELNARANRLARRLRRLGVQVDEPVAICAERSPALVVGVLAILKAGGAYLPLDPSYPPERLAFMLEDGLDGLAAPLLLAQIPLLSAAMAGAGVRLIDLDLAAGPAGTAGGATDAGAADLDGGAGADNLAYVIYTSGSTGRPKGVMSTHRGVVNRLLWGQRTFGLTPADRVLQKTPVSFDVSVWELFWPLVVGARLVLARPGGHRDPAYLARRIEEQGVTMVQFVPSMLKVFLEQADLGRCRSLERVIVGGEALAPELARRFHELGLGAGPAGAGLYNLYGPTEAAIEATAHATSPASARRSVPIGRPIANLGVWLLDPELRPVPLGVPGGLYIGGVALARGYLRRPGLTAERFVPHPLGRPGERLYRTGDLARFLADGEIEFLGRTDDQVKLRGFRIELGEIEAALRGHPAVREAAVVAREERPGEMRLAAYVVPAAAPGPEERELREALRRVLPEHMVPTDFVLVDALPLTPSGKLDRGALRGRRPARELAPAAAPAEPETELEELVAGIWQDLLGRQPIGVDANLFDLGAHSFLALQFTARVHEALDLEVPIHLLFESSTVRQLGAAIQDILLEQIESLSDEEAELQAK